MPVARVPASRSNTITPYGARRERGRTSPSPSRLLRRHRDRGVVPDDDIIELLHQSVDRALEVEHLDAPSGSRLGWSARGTTTSRNSNPHRSPPRATHSRIESPPSPGSLYLGEGPRSPDDGLRSHPRGSRRPSSPAERLEALVRNPPLAGPYHPT